MSKRSINKLMTAALAVGTLGVVAAPLTTSAMSGHYDRDRDRDDHYSAYTMQYAHRGVSWWQARAIAQEIFPGRTVQSVVKRYDNGVWEFQVQFTDGTRVDVQQRNGHVTYVHSSRWVNVRQAERIAAAVLPHHTVRSVVVRTNEYRVRFTDGSRVDVRASDGMILRVLNAYRMM